MYDIYHTKKKKHQKKSIYNKQGVYFIQAKSQGTIFVSQLYYNFKVSDYEWQRKSDGLVHGFDTRIEKVQGFWGWILRVIVSVFLKISVYFIKRIYFFLFYTIYFTLSLLQSINISLSILNIYFNKIFILLHYLLWQEIRLWQEGREEKEINKIIYTKL